MHDAAYKLLFSHPRMVEDLLRGFAAPGWSDSLDFSTLEKLPSELVSDDLRRRWTAPADVSELVALVGEGLARYQPVQRYFVLDARSRGDDDLPWGNLVSAVVRLENSRTPADLWRAVDAAADWLRRPGAARDQAVVREWVRLVLAQRGRDVSELPSRPQLEEVQTMLADQIQDWLDEAEEKGFTRGLARAMAQGAGPEVERRIRQDIERGIETRARRATSPAVPGGGAEVRCRNGRTACGDAGSRHATA